MLNLDELNSGHDASFFAVSSGKCKARSRDGEMLNPRGPILGASRSVASSEGCSRDIASGRALRLQPTQDTTAFVILGGDLPTTSKRDHHSLRSRSSLSPANLVAWVVALAILLCLVVHVVGLLVFFTPWYNNAIQVWIFRRFYVSFSSASGFQSDVNAKRSAVACVYLLCVGVVPTALAGSLWFTFSSHRRLRTILSTPSSFLRRKPVFFSSWRPLYLDVSTGELLVLALLFAANAFLFVHVLLRAKTNVWSSPSDKIWRDVSRAFAFNAVFSTVWLLLMLLKPSSWSLYLDLFGISSPQTTATYRKWLGGVVVSCSSLHALCMAVHFALKGELTSRLMPAWSDITSDPVVGITVAGEMALGAMLAGWTVVFSLRRRFHPSFLVLLRRASALVAVGALCVHYPVPRGTKN